MSHYLILRLMNYDVWESILVSNSLKNIGVHENGNYCYVGMVKSIYAYINICIYRQNDI